MKKMTLIFGIALFLGLFAFNNNTIAQAVVISDGVSGINTGYDFYTTYYFHAVVTPSGNIKRTVKFWLDPNDPLVPEHGVSKITTSVNFVFEGENYYLVDESAILTSNGNFKLEYNFNPAGNSLP